jgi:SRSO17 transposase
LGWCYGLFMTPQELKALDHRLSTFLDDLLAPMGRSERRNWARVYIQGLLLDGERKSIEPIASRIPGADVQALRQFVGQSPWAVEEVQRRLALKVVDLLSEPEVWILDDTSFPKAGTHSVGVARQYCGALGKVANCQVAVSLHWSNSEASCPLGWRLFLPKEWVKDPQRLMGVKAPSGIEYRGKRELALELIDQVLDWEVPKLPVVADTFYGNEFDFREQLRRRKLSYVMEAERTTVVWLTDPSLPLPPAKPRGRPRKYPPLRDLPQPKDLRTVAVELAPSHWRTLVWREGSKGDQKSRFALLKVWPAHNWTKGRQPERVPEWLLVKWPANEREPTKYWLAHFGARRPGMRRLIRMAHSRWRIELDYRELKDELGLDHYEGRHWVGWHHHVTLVTLAHAFLRSEQARVKKNSWCDLSSNSSEAPSPAH